MVGGCEGQDDGHSVLEIDGAGYCAGGKREVGGKREGIEALVC